MRTWNEPKELEEEILARCHVQKNGWVNMDHLTCHVPYSLLQRCGRQVAFGFGPIITGIITPPSRGVLFADRVAEYLQNLIYYEYPRRDPYKQPVPPGFIPLTVLSPSNDNQPMDYIMPEYHPGDCLFLFVDDVLRSSKTALAFISFVTERWPGWKCAGCAFLIEIIEKSNEKSDNEKRKLTGRKMLKQVCHLEDSQILALARIDLTDKGE